MCSVFSKSVSLAAQCSAVFSTELLKLSIKQQMLSRESWSSFSEHNLQKTSACSYLVGTIRLNLNVNLGAVGRQNKEMECKCVCVCCGVRFRSSSVLTGSVAVFREWRMSFTSCKLTAISTRWFEEVTFPQLLFTPESNECAHECTLHGSFHWQM